MIIQKSNNPATFISLKNDIKLAALAKGGAPKAQVAEGLEWLERVKHVVRKAGK